jgi:hypothetical protein
VEAPRRFEATDNVARYFLFSRAMPIHGDGICGLVHFFVLTAVQTLIGHRGLDYADCQWQKLYPRTKAWPCEHKRREAACFSAVRSSRYKRPLLFIYRKTRLSGTGRFHSPSLRHDGQDFWGVRYQGHCLCCGPIAHSHSSASPGDCSAGQQANTKYSTAARTSVSLPELTRSWNATRLAEFYLR